MKPEVHLHPTADSYSMDHEKIIQVSSPNGGCLISLIATADGRLSIEIYRADPTVDVAAPGMVAIADMIKGGE